jgi:signal transduction histidine kinase
VEQNSRSLLRFAILSALAFVVVLGLVWAIVFRERSVRRLYLEYEAFRASAVLLEAFRQDSNLSLDDARVLGFGVYALDGRALVRNGTAPASLQSEDFLARPSAFDIKRSSLVMKRPLGPEMPGLPGLRGLGNGRGMGGMMRGLPLDVRPAPSGQRLAPGSPNAPGPEPRRLRSGLQAPRSLWIEYALGAFWRERGLLLFGAMLATAGAIALYLILLGLYRRNLDLRRRESRNSELVQLGQAASTLVHEIKNPLGIIRVQAASLRRLGSPEASSKAELIEEEVVRLAGLADRIRDFLKGGEGKPVDLELGTWLRDYASRYSTGRDASEAEGRKGLEIAALPASAKVRIDPERLAHALDNLVANAREATGDGRMPEISVSRRTPHRALWEIEVADRGGGVPEEISERIFEPFFTTKTQGSGIGLALARRIARAAGGELLYRPRPGGGAVFVMQLPARAG